MMTAGLFLAAALAAASAVEPTIPAASRPPAARSPEVSLALEAVQTALLECKAKGVNASVALVDAGGSVKALLAQDGAGPASVETSIRKALTALAFRMTTADLMDRIKMDPAFLQAALNDAPSQPSSRLFVRPGGIPIVAAGEVIGAIGVGGARQSEIDHACAAAGLAKIESRLSNPGAEAR